MTENDVTLMTKSDMIAKIPLWELIKSRLDFQNGRRDTSQPAQDRKTTTTKSTEWKMEQQTPGSSRQQPK